jgi:hypothetical protein
METALYMRDVQSAVQAVFDNLPVDNEYVHIAIRCVEQRLEYIDSLAKSRQDNASLAAKIDAMTIAIQAANSKEQWSTEKYHKACSVRTNLEEELRDTERALACAVKNAEAVKEEARLAEAAHPTAKEEAKEEARLARQTIYARDMLIIDMEHAHKAASRDRDAVQRAQLETEFDTKLANNSALHAVAFERDDLKMERDAFEGDLQQTRAEVKRLLVLKDSVDDIKAERDAFERELIKTKSKLAKARVQFAMDE